DIGGGLPRDEAAWKQMVAVLTAMKPVLVKPSEERTGQMGQAEPVAYAGHRLHNPAFLCSPSSLYAKRLTLCGGRPGLVVPRCACGAPRAAPGCSEDASVPAGPSLSAPSAWSTSAARAQRAPG